MTKKAAITKIRANKLVEDVFSEHGNIHPDKVDWWVWLRPGYVLGDGARSLGCHSIHEQTLSECLRELGFAVPCECDSCAGVR